jgi:hypothetical protein
VTFKLSLDSSVIISHLSEDAHKDSVLAAVGRLSVLEAEPFLSLVCYAEVWTGIELFGEEEKRKQTVQVFQSLLQASRIMLVSDNVAVAQEAARAQAEYRRLGGRREVLIPDFKGRMLSTTQDDCLRPIRETFCDIFPILRC